MKTFLVPTDFSTAANNAVEYAAQLAQRANSKLELATIKLPDSFEVPVEQENCRYIRNTPDMLEEMSNSVSEAFSIPCSYIVEKGNDTLEKSVKDLSAEKDLIVMGSNGTDDLYQYFFGSNTYHVIKKVKCPVFAIPEGYHYKKIEKIVFAWDYATNNKNAFLEMCQLMKDFEFHPEIILLHISKKDSEVGEEVFHAIKEDVCSSLNEHLTMRFDRIFCEDTEDFTDKLIEYMSDINADLLAVTYYKRSIFQRMFHGTILRKLTDANNFPLLVLHVQ